MTRRIATLAPQSWAGCAAVMRWSPASAAADVDTLHRHLLWTLYLNDDFDEDETEFLFQQRKIEPLTGSLGRQAVRNA